MKVPRLAEEAAKLRSILVILFTWSVRRQEMRSLADFSKAKRLAFNAFYHFLRGSVNGFGRISLGFRWIFKIVIEYFEIVYPGCSN